MSRGAGGEDRAEAGLRWDSLTLTGWGRVARAAVTACAPRTVEEARAALAAAGPEGILAAGAARSYGDAGLNSNGRVVLTRALDTVHSFDAETGRIVCGAGVRFRQLLDAFLPRGYIAPVTPGTADVSLGGALANDVHGKNHDRCGSFGDHVEWIDLLLPDGELARVSPERAPDVFAATVGGIGLTGIVLGLCFKMHRVRSNAVRVREERIADLDGFLARLAEIRSRATYSIGWMDALARGAARGRGILIAGEPSAAGVGAARAVRPLPVPEAAAVALNAWTVRAFNELYYRRVPRAGRERLMHVEKFFYPLDAVPGWNRFYGRRGFYQFQCVLPDAESRRGLVRLLDEISRRPVPAFLASLKTLGGEGKGFLSFPLRGYTLALDFPNRPATRPLLAALERITLDCGGRVYLAKDACLSAATFEAMYPRLDAFRSVLGRIDPGRRMRSDLARRLGIHASDHRRPAAVHHPENRAFSPPRNGRAGQGFESLTGAASMSASVESSGRPDLLSVEDAARLSVSETADLFCRHLNPGQYHFLKLLGMHEVLIERAEGMHYVERGGRRILDFFGGFGSLAFGHNHPRILAARRRFQEEKRHEIAMAFMSQYAAALARNLAAVAPADLDMVFLGSSGSEANEAALKLAERVQGPARSAIAYAGNSFHGKTRGALSVTDSAFYQSTFRLLDNRVRVPFGDAGALEAALERDRGIGVLILETVQGGAGIVPAPPEYWRAVRRLCDRHDVIWIADEVQCGVGRTGRFFAFEHAGVAPDIVTLAKSLGGGKAAVGAMISRRAFYMKAYGAPKHALIHGPATFGGMGEACCTAIEALNVLYDERLIENAARQGAYLLERLRELKARYPKLILDVRGQGLMIGIEFCDVSDTLPFGLRQAVSVLDDKLKGSVCGFVGSLLLRDHGVLVAFTEYNRNVIRLEPPLIAQREDIDAFTGALDDLLARGIARIVADYARHYLESGRR